MLTRHDMTPSSTPADALAQAELAQRTILLTDLVDSTRLVGELGDQRALEIAVLHERLARDLLPRFAGREIDKADGFLMLFERPADAVGFALAYHRALASLSEEVGTQLRSRIGIHLGEVLLRHNSSDDVARGAKPLEVDGLAKPMAARIMALAKGRQTLLTDDVFDASRQEVTGELSPEGLNWLAHGPYLFKGFDEPVDVFEVGEEGLAPLAAPPDTDKARRAVVAGDEVTLGWRPGPGLRIPRRPGWRLESRLSQGGFGEVWIARCEQTADRRVFKFCYDAERLRALQREVTLFRLLKESLGERGDIVRILDWNFDRAPYYLESEYTGAADLVDWVERQGGFDAVPMPARLELLAQIAEALAAAHSVGVLHKDVKPLNVLVSDGGDGRPQALLTDFGIGQLTDKKALLAKGITVLGLTEMPGSATTPTTGGTELYRAPELTEGKPATVQADIYALGVMIYQFVTGDFRHALAPGWRRDVEDELLADDIASFVDGAPERRAGSALHVAERLRTLEERRARIAARHRAQKQAEATERALELAHRRRRFVAAVAAMALVVLVVVSTLAVQAMNARSDAERARAEEKRRRAEAEELVEFMTNDLYEKLKAVGRLEIMNEAAGKVVEYFERIPTDELTDSGAFHHSRALLRIGQIRLAEGRPGEAMAAFSESLALTTRLAEKDPHNQEWQVGLGVSHYSVGSAHYKQGDLDSALERFQSQLAIQRAVLADDPENPRLQKEVAYALSNIGYVERARGNLDGALEAFRASLAIKSRLAPPIPEGAGAQLDLSEQYNLVAAAFLQLGQLEEALEHLRRGHEIAQAMLAKESSSTLWKERLAKQHSFMARGLAAKGLMDRAREQNEAARVLLEQLVTTEPANTKWQRRLAVAHGRLGRLMGIHGDLAAAKRHFLRRHEILEHLGAATSSILRWRLDFAASHLQLGENLGAQGAPVAALSHARAALAILEEIVAEDPEQVQAIRWFSAAHVLLGRALAATHDRPRAISSWHRAADILAPYIQESRDLELVLPWLKAQRHLDRHDEAHRVTQRLQKLGYATDLIFKEWVRWWE